MATKLKNPLFTKVDVVDEGANQRANIVLMKGKHAAGDGIPDAEIQDAQPAEGLFKRFTRWLTGQGMADEDIRKAAESFDANLNEANTGKVCDEIWEICYAIQRSLISIVRDDELDAAARQQAMHESLGQFQEAMAGFIPAWSDIKLANVAKSMEAPDEADMQMITKDRDRLNDIIEKSTTKKGAFEEMAEIDKSRMTPEEIAVYDSIVKKYAVDTSKACGDAKKQQEDPEETEKGCGTSSTKKSLAVPGAETVVMPGSADIYAGLHPEVAKELKALRKRADEAEERELFGIAKRYEVIGKKPEELVPVLKSLKAAGGTAYDDMISVLDGAVEAMEKSGIFSEIGKSRSGGDSVIQKSAAEGKIDTIAKAYIEKDPTMSMARAIAKAWEDHPELMADYETEAGF